MHQTRFHHHLILVLSNRQNHSESHSAESHSELESTSLSWIFSRKQAGSSGKRIDKLKFSRNWRDSIRGHISANGFKDGRSLQRSLIVPKMPAFFHSLATTSFSSSVDMYYIIQRAILRAMVWELKDDSQPLCRLAPCHFQVLQIFVMKTMY